jgi:hypothetical protein
MNEALVDLAHPLLRRITLGFHLFAGGWLLLNGVGHQAHVLWKARAGTLHHDADLSSLLGIGVGLMVAGALFTWAYAPLSAAATRASVLPAFGGIAFLGVLLGVIASRYGFTFLGGSIALGVVDAGLLAAHALANVR